LFTRYFAEWRRNTHQEKTTALAKVSLQIACYWQELAGHSFKSLLNCNFLLWVFSALGCARPNPLLHPARVTIGIAISSMNEGFNKEQSMQECHTFAINVISWLSLQAQALMSKVCL
jgi:hypothetical protein